MNKIFITHSSAFLVYRAYRNSEINIKLSNTNTLPNNNDYFDYLTFMNSMPDMQTCHISKYDITVTNNNATHKNANIKFHVNSQNFPKSAFRQINNKLYIASPELLFWEMAEYLTYENLFLLGLELCGTYSIDKSEQGFSSNIKPITSNIKIAKFVNEISKLQHNHKGGKQAITVASLLQNFCASPQESRLYIVLASPRKYGGFGINNLIFNQKVKLSSEAQKICGRNFIKPDICNPKNKIAIEYDSDAFHDNNQNRKDKRKLDAYICDKWIAFSFVSDQMYDKQAIKNLCLNILKQNGQCARIRNKKFDEKLSCLLKNLYK